MRVLALVGAKSEMVSGEMIQNSPAKDAQADEIWSFTGKEDWQVKNGDAPTIEGAYTFLRNRDQSKLALAWHLGRRAADTTEALIEKLNEPAAGEFQITTGGFKPYHDAVVLSLGAQGVDFAQLVKLYAASPEGETRYSPAECIGCKKTPIFGNPDRAKISTSHVQRQNLTMRMQIRRFTRLTNALSKKWENLKAAYALWFAYYNLCRVQKTLRVIPAMEAGITNHVWTMEEMLTTIGL